MISFKWFFILGWLRILLRLRVFLLDRLNLRSYGFEVLLVGADHSIEISDTFLVVLRALNLSLDKRKLKLVADEVVHDVSWRWSLVLAFLVVLLAGDVVGQLLFRHFKDLDVNIASFEYVG